MLICISSEIYCFLICTINLEPRIKKNTALTFVCSPIFHLAYYKRKLLVLSEHAHQSETVR